MYQIKCDQYTLYDPRLEELTVLNAKCKLEVNTVGEASFTILPTHPYYDKLQSLKSIFEIKQDGYTLFRGRMTNNSRNLHNNLDVDLEGVLGFTNDTVIPPFVFPDAFPDAETAENVVEYFLRWIIDRHNEQVEDWQKLKVGNVTVTDPNNHIERSSEKYLMTWETLKSKLFDSSLGGYLCIRYESDGNYVDYLNDFELTNTQQITLGENLMDITNISDASETYSAIIPLGAEQEVELENGGDWEGMYVTIKGTKTLKQALTVESLPDGDLTDDVVKKGQFIYSKSAVAKYGWKCAPVDKTTWGDVTDVSNLKNKAIEFLTGTAMFLSGTTTIKAVDLHFTDEEIQSFRIYRNVLVNSPAHGVSDRSYRLMRLDIDIFNPQNTDITLGDTIRTMVDINDSQNRNVDVKIGNAKMELVQTIESTIHSVDVGTRNLLRKTNPEKWFDEWTAWQTTKITLQDNRWVFVENPNNATSYGVILPKISTIPSAGKYMLSFDAYSDNATQLDYIYIMKNSGNVALQLLIPITSTATRYEIPITLADGYTDCNIMIGTKSGTSFYVRDIMLSSGNLPTDWTPAPEDFDERLDDSVTVLHQTVLEQRTAVMNDCEKIIMSALESYVETGNYEEFKQTVEAQFSIMADRMEMNFTTTTEQIQNVNGDIQAEVSERKKYITFSENGITIGVGENAMTLELDNDMIKFKKNGIPFGWWDGVDFHTGNIMVEVNERAQFGNFAFVPRSDGSLMFLKVGVKMAINGSKRVAVTNWNELIFEWGVTSQSIVNNTSTIAWLLKLTATSDGAISSTANKEWTVTINGQTYRGYNTVGMVNGSTKVLANGTATITHYEDGSGIISYHFSQYFGITFSGSKIGTVDAYGSGTLDTIQRVSDFTVSEGTLGVAQTITITRRSTAFTHGLTYSCGSVRTQLICAWNTTTGTVSFEPPLDLAWQAVNGNRVWVDIHLQTYHSDGTPIGNTITKGVWMTIPASIKPSCSVAVSDPTGHAAKFGAYIQGQSKLAIKVTPTTSYGSVITGCLVTADGNKYTNMEVITPVIQSTGQVEVYADVTDTRGRLGATSTKVTVLPYTRPVITTLKVHRCDKNGTENDRGAYCKVSYGYTVDTLGGKNGMSGYIQYKKTTETEYTSMELSTAFSVTNGTYIFAADDGSTYDVQLLIADSFVSVGHRTALSTAHTLIHFSPTGKGITFGGIRDDDGFNIVDMPFKINDIAVDYIVEQGEIDGWFYRKWNGGFAECWKIYYGYGITSAKNNYSGFYYSETITVPFPFTFTNLPTVTVDGGSVNYMNFVRVFGKYEDKASFSVISLMDAGNIDVTVDIKAIGKWK